MVTTVGQKLGLNYFSTCTCHVSINLATNPIMSKLNNLFCNFLLRFRTSLLCWMAWRLVNKKGSSELYNYRSCWIMAKFSSRYWLLNKKFSYHTKMKRWKTMLTYTVCQKSSKSADACEAFENHDCSFRTYGLLIPNKHRSRYRDGRRRT